MSGSRAAKELRKQNSGRSSDPICLEDDDAILARVLYESELEAGVGAADEEALAAELSMMDRPAATTAGGRGAGAGGRAEGRSGNDAAGRRGVGRKQDRESSEEIVVDRNSPNRLEHQSNIRLCAHHRLGGQERPHPSWVDGNAPIREHQSSTPLCAHHRLCA